MTGRRFALGLTALFLLAFAAKLAQGIAWCGGDLLFFSFGGALATVVVAGVIPFIWLAVRRFHLQLARGALPLWFVLAAVMLAMSAYTAHWQYAHGLC